MMGKDATGRDASRAASTQARQAEGGQSVEAAAPAKVNLYLHVLGRRADGRHSLDGLVAFAGVGDTVTVTATDAPAPSLRITGPMAKRTPAGPDNLVLRAASELARRVGRAPGVAIALVKRLPVAAGLGGGSSDAAASLKALAALWGLDSDDDRVVDVGRGLGSDVPVCLFARPAYLGGAGEIVEAGPRMPPVWLVLANPGCAVSTAAVYAAREGPFSTPARLERAPQDAAELSRMLAARRNDLAAPARSLAPAIDEVLTALEGRPGALLARVTGSGATCFALFARRARAEAAASELARTRPAWWVRAAPLLSEARKPGI
jgi:4-diphosphocytidyl-2-C-methyl-D-erythritol kinase